MKDCMLEYDLPEPKVTNSGQSFILTLKRTKKQITLQLPRKYELGENTKRVGRKIRCKVGRKRLEGIRTNMASSKNYH